MEKGDSIGAKTRVDQVLEDENGNILKGDVGF